jgi:glutathione S-transferase
VTSAAVTKEFFESGHGLGYNLSMRTLYHSWVCPFSRKIRIILGEKKLAFEMVVEHPWAPRPDYMALDPAGHPPLLVEPDGVAIADHTAIAEYLDEAFGDPLLIGLQVRPRAEVRRLIGWFDGKFNREVTANLVGEKVFKRQMGGSSPDSRAIRAGLAAIGAHLDYLGHLAEQRRWLAGEQFSMADIVACAHLSAVDYVGDVPWDQFPAAKDWYARMKSRPSVRPLLTDNLPGIPPPPHYANLDF